MEDSKLINQFQTIETRLDTLLQICQDKDSQNKELSRRIEQLEEELRIKVEAEQKYAEEKALIRSRIDQLLMRLDAIAQTDGELA